MVMEISAQQPAQPNHYVRLILNTIEERVGKDVLTLLLAKAGLTYLIHNFPDANTNKDISFDKFSALMLALERQFGEKAGRRFAYQIGRQVFPRVLENYGELGGISQTALAYVPLDRRLGLGLSALVNISNQTGDQNLTLEEDRHYFYIKAQKCATCWGRNHASEPICELFVGFLDAGIRYLCDGEEHQVKEIECKAKGDPACVFRVKKSML